MLSETMRRVNSVPRQVWVGLCLALLVGLFFWRVLTPKVEDRVAFPGGDFTDQFYTWRLYEARELTAGRLPLWNPLYNSGHPFQADAQSAVFYPVALAVLAVSFRDGVLPVTALQNEALLHFFLAGLFTYLFVLRLLRRDAAARGRPPGGHTAALISGVTFAFGGYLTSYPPLQLAVLETVTWLPLWLLTLDFAAERLTLRSAVGAGVALGMAVLAGHTQTLLFVVYAGVLYYAFRVWSQRPASAGLKGWSRPAVVLVVALAAAVGLAAVQLLPSLEYASLSVRSGLAYGESSTGMPPLQLLQALLPGSVSAFASPLYVGILPLWLALTAVASRRDRQVAFWLGLALLAVLDMLGGFSFFYGLLYLLAPGFALFRGQERAACLFSFALAVLAGYGAEQFLHWLPRAARRTYGGALRILAWAPLGGLILTLAYFYATKASTKPGSFVFMVDRAALMTLLLLLAGGVVAARLSGRLRPWQSRLLVVLLVVFDLFTINWTNNQAPVKDRFPETAIVRAMQAGTERVRVDLDALPGHAGVVYDLADIRGISPLRVRAYDALLRGLPDDRLWSLLGVRYVITDGAAPAGATALAKGGTATLYRLPNPSPRAWLASQVVVEPDAERAVALMAAASFNLPRTAVVDRAPQPTPLPDTLGTVQLVDYGPQRLAVKVSVSGSALLVMSEVYYPGWVATVDGVPAEIYRADAALRAVVVPAGVHTVEMSYQPLTFQVAAAISLVTLALVVVVAAQAAQAARRARP